MQRGATSAERPLTISSFVLRGVLLTKDRKERTRAFILLLKDAVANNDTSMDFADRNVNFPTNKTSAMWALFITGCFSTRPVRTDADIDRKDGWRMEWLLANFSQQLNALGGHADGDRLMEDAVGETAEKLTKQSTDIRAVKEVSLPFLFRHTVSHASSSCA